MNGYEVNIIKSIDPLVSYLCYKDPINVLPNTSTPTHICPHQGRYVNMSIERRPGEIYPNYDNLGAIINLCEFEVYGCNIGYYGNNSCKTQCSANCKNSRCDPDDGTCTCNTGWKGNRCNESACPSGQYGQPCKSCPSGCLNGVCNGTDGQCIDGCKPSLHGPLCDQPCPVNCAGGTCNKDTGQCNGCISGSHGSQCDQPCPGNCANGTCNRLSGHCSGCVSGYYGTNCKFKCPTRCRNDKCNQNSGWCNSCEGFFMGRECTECLDGKHGIHCNKTCPAGCKANICHRNTGTCTNGCIHTNLISSTCNECLTGYFGENCTSRCWKNCFSCEKETGHCYSCNGNFFGPTCTACQQGYYGFSCQIPCPSFCRDEECDPRIGYCTRGCIDGMYGIFCNLSCSTNCSLSKCHQINGDCAGMKCLDESRRTQSNCNCSITGPVVGSVFATLTLVCVIHAVIFMIRRIRTKKESTNYENATPNRNDGNTTENSYEVLKKSSIYTNEAFYECMSGTAESAEQNEDITQNYETP